MSPDLALAPDLAAAARVLRDPSLPGAPWTEQAIASVLPLLADGPSPPEVEAVGMRWLAAVDSGLVND